MLALEAWLTQNQTVTEALPLQRPARLYELLTLKVGQDDTSHKPGVHQHSREQTVDVLITNVWLREGCAVSLALSLLHPHPVCCCFSCHYCWLFLDVRRLQKLCMLFLVQRV